MVLHSMDLTTSNKGEWRAVETLLNANSNTVIGGMVLKCFANMLQNIDIQYTTKTFK